MQTIHMPRNGQDRIIRTVIIITISASLVTIFCASQMGCRDNYVHSSAANGVSSNSDDHAGHAHGADSHDDEHTSTAETEEDAHGGYSHGDDRHGHSDEGDKHSHAQGADEHVDEVTLTAEAVQRHGIQVKTASLHQLNPTFVSPARVAFNAEAIAHVGSTLPGRVVELAVRIGDVVAKGDLLLVIESPQLAEAQSNYLAKLIAADTTKATTEIAKNALDRATRLYDENRGIALDEVQRREIEYRAASASVETAEATVVAAEHTLYVLGMTRQTVDKVKETQEVQPRFSIVAPISGEVVEREVTLGELVSPEREQLLVIANVETLWVLADVPETHIPQLALGARAWINSGALDRHQHTGEVSYIAPTIDPRKRTVSVRVAVECEDRSLKPGMFVEVEISATERNSSSASPVIAVPHEAIQTIEGAPSLFVPVPDEPNTFARRSISIGKPVGGLVPVLSGLTEGEPYVASSSFILKADLGKATADHQH